MHEYSFPVIVDRMQWFAQIVDFVCSETYPIKSNNLFEFLATLIGRIVQTDKSGEDFPVLIAKHLSTLHKATNRLCLHLLNRLQVHISLL